MSDEQPFLIVGNSAAAVGAIAGIRETDGDTPITLIAREPEHTYSRPLMSYLLAGKVSEEQMLYRDRDFYEKSGVTAVLGVEVTRIDAGDRTVETDDGRRFAFGKLLIATGGAPVVPTDIPGADAQGVFTFATWEDARRIKSHIETTGATRAVVVGGGLIGLKAVEALVELDIQTTVVELADHILSATLDLTASDLALDFLKGKNVEVHCGTTVSEIVEKQGTLAGTRLRDGTELPCELLIFAIGVAPDTRLAREAGITCRQGIVTDDAMHTSARGIYAAGDVVETLDLLTGARRPIPILPNAYRQGFIAGANMAGGSLTWNGGLSMNAVDICGLPTISVGITSPREEGHEILSTLDNEAGTYRKIVLRDNRIVGAIFVGRIDRAGIFTGLIREKVDVSGFKELLLSQDFGLISLPKEYRKHVVSGVGIEV